MSEDSLSQLKSQIAQYIEAFPWIPQEGPQEAAYFSEADLCLFGGAAGGGKTSLAVGYAITRAVETLFIRREGTQLGGVLDEIGSLIDPDRKGYSAQPFKEWKIPAWDGVHRKIVMGSTPNLGDETRYQGRARDFLVIDEAANMLESQCAFLRGWVRSTRPGQRCRTLLCSNPPTSAEGMWLIEWFAPWLDPNHPNPAQPGELRWFIKNEEGHDEEVESGDTFMRGEEQIIPESRTFIPSKITDNAYLRDTGYLAVLQGLPEPLRSQMLYGSFTASMEDDLAQVIPSEWVEMAMKRWVARPLDPQRIVSVGVDPSRGGRDDTVIALREDWHFHELERYPGSQMVDGNAVTAKVLELCGTSMCPVHVDVIGIGASVVDSLSMHIQSRVVPVTASERASEGADWSGTMTFMNKRAELWWRFRDLLNPANGYKLELPPDSRLKAELCAPRYELMASGIKVESKKDMFRRLGRSTDSADAVLMAAERTAIMQISGSNRSRFAVKGALRSNQ